MDLSFVFAIAIVADAALLKLIPDRRSVVRFMCTTIFFAVHTVLLVALVGSPLHPVFTQQNALRGFWLQILACCWWALAARQLISFLAMSKALRGLAVDNELLSDILTACIYVSSALAMMAIVFNLPLQGLLATSGIVAIVLGLALQSTLSDVFSGISLSIEKSYRLGDEIFLEGGIEGEVIRTSVKLQDETIRRDRRHDRQSRCVCQQLWPREHTPHHEAESISSRGAPMPRSRAWRRRQNFSWPAN
jgi:small-conductance mechanosensitive channel